MSAWATTVDTLTMNPKLPMDPTLARWAAPFNIGLARMVAEDKVAGVALADDARFVTLLTAYADERHHLRIDVTGIPPEHVVSWAKDRLALLHRRLNVYLAPISAHLHPR